MQCGSDNLDETGRWSACQPNDTLLAEHTTIVTALKDYFEKQEEVIEKEIK